MASTLPQDNELYSLIQSMYQDYLGRAPDNGGQDWWYRNAHQWLDKGGVPQLRDAFTSEASIRGPEDNRFYDIKSNLVPYANNLTQDMAFSWNDYMNNAAAEQQGMNKMPGVFNDYLGLYNAATPEAANALMYNTPDQQKAALEAASKYWQTAGGFGGLGASGSKTTPTTTTEGGPKTIDVDGTTYYLNQGRFVPQGSN